MHLFKNLWGLTFLSIASLALFYLANSHGIASRLANLIAPCEQNPANSFPCNGGYDIALMAVSAILAVTLIIMLVMHYFKH
jgi:hypothetical protein